MLKKRLIARLDIKAPNLVKTVRLEGLRKLGDPYERAEKYDQDGIDEIIYLDIVASLYGRNSLCDLVDRTSAGIFCPLTVGGGVRSVEDAQLLLRSGADKVALNTAAVKRPELITELANKFGSQSIVLQIDAKEKDSGYEAWTDGGRDPSGIDAVSWAAEGIRRGAGEILVTSVGCEGTTKGIDSRLLEGISSSTVPIIYGGGVGESKDVVEAFDYGADGVAMAHVLHYETVGLDQIRMAANAAGQEVRDELERH
jgi:cyclase